MSDKTILLVGTYDTKDDELTYLAETIRGQGGRVLSMDVSVLGDPSQPTDISKHQVAEAGARADPLADHRADRRDRGRHPDPRGEGGQRGGQAQVAQLRRARRAHRAGEVEPPRLGAPQAVVELSLIHI